MRKISTFIFLAIPSYAYAWDEGRDALFLGVIQLAILILSLGIFAFRNLSLARRGYAFLGCVVGVVASWIVSAFLPFNDNRALVVDIFVYLPLFGLFASLALTEKPRTAWKTYFFFFLVLSAPSITPLVYYTVLEWAVDLSFLVITTVGLFGFAWSKPILDQRFWKVLAPICVMWNLGHAFVMIQTIEPAITTMLALPSLIGVCLYAFQANQIWQHISTQEALNVDQQS